MTDGERASNPQGDCAPSEEEQEATFDFERHRRTAVEEYLPVLPRYEAFADAVRDILNHALKAKGITVNPIDARVKKPESFGAKAATPSDCNQGKPKYLIPLEDIKDLAGVRIITSLPSVVKLVGDCIREEFVIDEYTDLSQALLEEERFGYQSQHYLVKLGSTRTALPEYKQHLNLIAEVQVRTILQHAWAEIEHDIQYKSSSTTPDTVRRRFMALAGLLEIADREFQAIQDGDELLKPQAKSSVEKGVLDQLEITAEVLRSYIDGRVGTDARVSDFSYEYMARVLRGLGFATIEQVDGCIEGYDGDQFTQIRGGWRQGPITRFEDMLLTGMGHVYIKRRTNDAEWRNHLTSSLESYRENGIPIGNYDPKAELGVESAD